MTPAHPAHARLVRRSRALRRAPLAVGLLAAACKVGPDPGPPQATTPSRWLHGGGTTRAEGTSVAGFWARFDDPQLVALLARARESNRELAAAAARVRAARARAGFARSELAPEVDATGSYAVERPTLDPAFGPPSRGRASHDRFRAGFDASWELDLFGGLARAAEAAAHDANATEELRLDLLVSVQAEVARSYFELRGAQHEIAILADVLAVRRALAQLTETRARGGLATSIEIARSRAAEEETEAALAATRARAETSLQRIATLVAEDAAVLAPRLVAPSELPSAPPAPPLGVPAELLLHRPDLRAAAEAFAAATARIGVARADLYPRFSLTGFLIGDAGDAGSLLDPDRRAGALGPGFSWHLLDAGRVRRRIAEEEARRDQSAAQYAQAVLVAVEEVESALARARRAAEQVEHLARGTALARDASDAARERFASGLEDFLAVLDADDARQRVELAWNAGRTDLAVEQVALWKALGGDRRGG